MDKIPHETSYYGVLTADVRHHKELPDKAKLLYADITALSNLRGYCFASNKYLANLYNVHPGTISRNITLLEKFGFVNIEFIYKENSKEIQQRRIYPYANSHIPLRKNVHTPLRKNVKDNTKDLTTTTKPVEIYREVFPHFQLNDFQEGQISLCTDTDKLKETLHYWKLKDYKPSNVFGILEVYKNGLPKAPQGSSNGGGKKTTGIIW